MSIYAMTRGSMRFQPKGTAGGAAVAAAKGKTRDGVPTAIERIASFIPSEAIGAYIAGFGIIKPTSLLGKWSIFAVGAALIPFFVFAANWGVGKQAVAANLQSSLSYRRGSLIILIAMVAYIVWVAAMPQSLFVDMYSDANRVGSYAAVVLSFILPTLAKKYDVVI
jgi:hypothetical protein